MEVTSQADDVQRPTGFKVICSACTLAIKKRQRGLCQACFYERMRSSDVRDWSEHFGTKRLADAKFSGVRVDWQNGRIEDHERLRLEEEADREPQIARQSNENDGTATSRWLPEHARDSRVRVFVSRNDEPTDLANTLWAMWPWATERPGLGYEEFEILRISGESITTFM